MIRVQATRSSQNSRGLTRLTFGYLRTVTGLILAAALYFLFGFAMASVALGTALVLWVLFLGPLCVLAFVFFYFNFYYKYEHSLKLVNWALEPSLLEEYMKDILEMPGPRVRLWVRSGDDLLCYWFENFFKVRGIQDIVVSSAWMKQVPELRIRDWRALWTGIRALSRGERVLRSIQMILWASTFAPLEVLLWALQRALVFVYYILGEVPPVTLSFWFLRFSIFLRMRWFGSAGWPKLEAEKMLLMKKMTIAKHMNSLILSPWGQFPEREVNPVLFVMSDGRLFFPEVDATCL